MDDIPDDGAMAEERLPERAVQQVSIELEILNENRAVQFEFAADSAHILISGTFSQQGDDRVARDQMDEKKYCCGQCP